VPDTTEAPRSRLVEVSATSGRKPRSVERLRDWEYLERQTHRILCGWGRYFHAWPDIITAHRQVWDAAECVRRLRERLAQFPGNESNLDQHIARRLEDLANTVLDAPSHDDAIDGLFGLLGRALSLSYANYASAAHPIHDAPTLALINEVMTIREGYRLWLREYRRKRPHTTDAAYEQRVCAALAACGDLIDPLPPTTDDPAQPVGLRIDFKLPTFAAKPVGAEPGPGFVKYIDRDFTTRVEARRLFWAFGYMREINLAMDQLMWLWDTPYMPWAFCHDISRHLWDESRHGDSGYSRLLDFGITIPDIGLGSYLGDEPWGKRNRPPLRPHAAAEVDGAHPATGAADPRTPAEMYEKMFNIGMIAETGHFPVKREAYDDFKAGGDLESAEMMLFDIIDEQTHVQYAHRWLPVLAEHAGIEHDGYKERAAQTRKELSKKRLTAMADAEALSDDPNDPGYAKYVELIEQMRAVLPLSNAADRTPRTMLPMEAAPEAVVAMEQSGVVASKLGLDVLDASYDGARIPVMEDFGALSRHASAALTKRD